MSFQINYPMLFWKLIPALSYTSPILMGEPRQNNNNGNILTERGDFMIKYKAPIKLIQDQN